MTAGILVLIVASTLIICLVVFRSHRKKQSMYTDEEKRYILHDAVFYEILFAFGVSPYDETDYCAWEHLNFSRMGNARALYDFFETSEKKRDKREHDDVVSEDFGFPARRIQRPAEDRKRLNKDLFHLSYERLRHLKVPQNKPWPNTILGCLHEPCVRVHQAFACPQECLRQARRFQAMGATSWGVDFSNANSESAAFSQRLEQRSKLCRIIRIILANNSSLAVAN